MALHIGVRSCVARLYCLGQAKAFEKRDGHEIRPLAFVLYLAAAPRGPCRQNNTTTMKKIKLHPILHTALLLFAVFATTTTSAAYDFEEGGIYYNVNDDGASVTVTFETTDYNSYSGDIVIPETVTHEGTSYTVTAIGEHAFYNCTELTSVDIPQTVYAIGVQNDARYLGESFANCKNLTSIVIPDNVEILGRRSFSGCSGLRSVTIGKSIPALKLKKGSVTYNAFSGCNNITSLTWNARECLDLGGMNTSNFEQVTIGLEVEVIPDNFAKQSRIQEIYIPNSVKSIGNNAFALCDLMENATIGTAVSTIGNSAFEGCSRLSRIDIPNSTTTIGDNVFYGCSSLASATLGSSITSIGNQAFYGCSSLQNMEIPELVTKIGNGTFQNCSLLESIILPNLVTTIGSNAFQNCVSLKSIVLPDALTTIGSCAFQECEYLESIVVGNSVESIDEYAFYQCWELSKVYISDLEAWCKISFGHCANPIMYGAQLFLNGEEITVFVIPNTVTKIGDYMFHNFLNLTAVIIPSSVTSIGEGAFFGCRGLTNIDIPNSVTSIGDYAFDGCDGLTSITIPNSVTSIGMRAFEWCPSLESIFVENSNPAYDSRDNCNAIIETASNTLISGCKNTIIPNSVDTIGEAAFCGSGLTNISIPGSITVIGDEAFWDCENLTNVAISSSVTTIGKGAFSCCPTLTDINIASDNPVFDSRDNCNAIIETATNTLIFGCKNTVIPNTVPVIGNNAFDRCFEMTSISIPNSVETIGEEAFFLCSGLKDIIFGDGVTSIGANAFAVCESLENITIPNSVTSIGMYAFGMCTSLKSATIPNSFNASSSYTADLWFVECTGLTKVTIGSGIAYMGGMFYKCPNITSVTCLATTPPLCDAFMNSETKQRVYNFDDVVFNQATLYVPVGSLEAYQTHRDWKDFQDIRALGDADGDGKVGIADVVGLIDYLLSGDGKGLDMGAADVDGDGKVSIADVTELIDTLLSR